MCHVYQKEVIRHLSTTILTERLLPAMLRPPPNKRWYIFRKPYHLQYVLGVSLVHLWREIVQLGLLKPCLCDGSVLG